jgi:prepilin-type N-terminal cleavage/methylation domain-containing protein
MSNTILAAKRSRGFSLVELAVVLVILGFVIGAMLLPLQGQREISQRTQTENQLELARKALIGYAQTNGRLPCPAVAGATGVEAPLGGENCDVQLGFLPVATLGMSTTTDENGYAIDAWNSRIMYAVTQSNAGGAATADFTTSNDMNTVGLTALTPNLVVCPSATDCPAIYLVNNAAAVIYSLGPTGAQASGGADENENPTVPGTDIQFVSHGPTPTFDHLVVWISPYVLYNAMIQAGQLH